MFINDESRVILGKILLRKKGMDLRFWFQRTSLILMFLGIFLWGLIMPVSAAAPSGLPADLQALIDESLKANPEVKERAQIKAASQESIKPAGAKLVVRIEGADRSGGDVGNWFSGSLGRPLLRQRHGLTHKNPNINPDPDDIRSTPPFP